MLASRVLTASRALPIKARASARAYSSVKVMALAKAGDKLPKATLWENNPGTSLDITSLFKGKKGVLFAVPGAFTPTCSEKHLPSYIDKFDELTAKGAEVIVVVSANDPFVMGAWGKATGGAEKGIRFLADTQLQLAKGLGAEYDLSEKLGSVRLKRFSMVINDNVITHFNLEDETECSYAPKALSQL